MKKTKKIFIIGSILLILLTPSISSAATIEELKIQIAELLQTVQKLQEQLAQLQGEHDTQWCHDFNINLKIGDNGEKIFALQTALQKENLLKNILPTGYFGEITASGVVGFQERYANEILSPAGLNHGTGYVGIKTRIKLNLLYGCSSTSTPASIPPIPTPTPTLTPAPVAPTPTSPPTPTPPSPTPTPTPIPVTQGEPRGIYVLDNSNGANRDANIRDYPFVTGYTWRARWEDLETLEGIYDFSSVADIVKKVEAKNKKLTILLGGSASMEPDYIVSKAGVKTWTDPRSGKTRAVPWDTYVQERFKLFIEVLANYQITDSSKNGASVSLREHPTLANINFGIPGLRHIRESAEISGLNDYSRESFISVIKNSLRVQTSNFPLKFVYVGFWKVTDNQASPELWEDIRASLISEFNGINNPHIGFFMENLAASKDSVGAVTGYPNTDFSAPLYLSRNNEFIMFQALQGWNQPFAEPAKTAGGTPFDGIKYAYDTFGAKYFELYVPDLDDQSYWSEFQKWHDILLNQ